MTPYRSRGGDYDAIIEPANSGREGAPITYTNHKDDVVNLNGQPNVDKIVVIQDKSYIIVNGLNISYGHDFFVPSSDKRGQMRFPWIKIEGSRARRNVIRNCRLVRKGDPVKLYKNKYREWGIMLSGCRRCVIERCHIEGVNQGIQLSKIAQYNIIRNNTITGTAQSCVVFTTSKFKFQGNLVINNILEKQCD